MFIFGPRPLTIYMIERIIIRNYSQGDEEYGTANCITSNNLKVLTTILLHKKFLQQIEEDHTYLIFKYSVLTNGTIKLGPQSDVSLYTC